MVFLPLSVSSSLGIHSWVTTPPSRHLRECPLPSYRSNFSASCCHTTRRVPLPCFPNTSAAFSTLQPQIYCNLVTTMGFATFPIRDAAVADEHHHFPRNAIRTPRRIPLISSRTASLRPLPSCCYFALHIQPNAEAHRPAPTPTRLDTCESAAPCSKSRRSCPEMPESTVNPRAPSLPDVYRVVSR